MSEFEEGEIMEIVDNSLGGSNSSRGSDVDGKGYRILSVYSHKGGVGKTTMVDVIASAVHCDRPRIDEQLKFKKCLMIDLDTQMNLTQKILGDEDRFQAYIDGLVDSNDLANNRGNPDIKTKLTRLLDYDTRNDVNVNPMEVSGVNGLRGRCVHLIPGFPELREICKHMSIELTDAAGGQSYVKSLRHLIDEYVKVHHYDLVILDLGPDLYTMNACALWSSDFVLIPCTADMYSAMSFRLIANEIFPPQLAQGVQQDLSHPYYRYHSRLKILGFLPNRVKTQNCNPTHKQAVGINRLGEKFLAHLRHYFQGVERFEEGPGTHPCIINLIGSDIIGNESDSLVDLQITEPFARERLKHQLEKLIRWLNVVL